MSGGTARIRAMAAGVVCAVLLCGAVGRAHAEEPGAPAADPSVASNQGVELPAPSDDPAGGVEVPSETRPPVTLVRREQDRVGGVTDVDTPAVPWYRRGFVPLAIVLGAIALTAWAVRRWIPQARTGDGGVLRVVSRATIGPKQHVVLLQVARRYVLVGAAGDRLSVLSEIVGEEEVADLAARSGRTQHAVDDGFHRTLADAVEPYGEEEDAGRVPSAARRTRIHGAQSTLNRLLDRLRRMQT